MQQQRSQEDSYIHKRLIANINLGPVQRQKETLHNSYIYIYINMSNMNMYKHRHLLNNTRVKSQVIQTL